MRNEDPLFFISSGVACYALSLLHNIGILQSLIDQAGISFPKCENSVVIERAFAVLQRASILKKRSNLYSLTTFGKKVVEHIGSIELIYNGYRSIVAEQLKSFYNTIDNLELLIDGNAVAKASIFFSEKYVHPYVIEEFKKLQIKKRICDLGCGTAAHLINICRLFSLPGLGLELNDEALRIARENVSSGEDILIEKEDITKIKGIWNDVEVLMQYFVLHDFSFIEHCSSIINSYIYTFPSIKYFFFIDIVSYEHSSSILPGFDYIHALLGIKTRSYDETISLFRKSKFNIVKEIKIPNLPNTFLWILAPKVKRKCS